MSGMSPERLAEIEADRAKHGAVGAERGLLAEVKRLRAGIEAAAAASVDSADYAELTLETLQTDLHDLLNPTEGETDE
ncbi:hypothetical protein [Janibacter terrae]|uniref:hypothetical protein n=1 Tax=Janibacter terrae TaxID=103817 RepID=UPI0031F80F1B